MFEDIISETESATVNEDDPRKICPHCGSSNIVKGTISQLLDDTARQMMMCNRCANIWTIIYNEDGSIYKVEGC